MIPLHIVVGVQLFQCQKQTFNLKNGKNVVNSRSKAIRKIFDESKTNEKKNRELKHEVKL